MTDVAMINEMARMQSQLDADLLEKGKQLGKIEKYDLEREKIALIDELGELVHELKGNWCWWKATQKPVDQAKVLEELVDCWHFVLSTRTYAGVNCEYINYDRIRKLSVELPCSVLITNIIDRPCTYDYIIALSYYLHFTITDVYNEYIRKNKINYERIASGY